jgi:hypothetical protein
VPKLAGRKSAAAEKDGSRDKAAVKKPAEKQSENAGSAEVVSLDSFRKKS